MAKESVLQIRIDTALKDAAESLYRDMGTTFSEAVRIFARQSVLSRGMPFSLRASAPESFPSKEQASFNFKAAVTVHNDSGTQENKICYRFHFSPFYLP